MFSVIKKFRDRPEFVLPDRNAVTMTAPFMRAYTELLVKTCHRRGAHAMGGMAAFIPSRRDAELNERALRRCERTSGARRATASTAPGSRTPTWSRSRWRSSTRVLGGGRTSSTGSATTSRSGPAELLDVAATPGEITEEGLRNDVSVGIHYLSAWLRGSGAVAIDNLMEDAATAEIARSQVWQWVRHGHFDAGAASVSVIDEELERLRADSATRSSSAAARRGSRALRAGRARRGAGGVPDAPCVRAAGLTAQRYIYHFELQAQSW